MLCWCILPKARGFFTLPLILGKRQCYPGVDAQKDDEQGLYGVNDEHEEEGIVLLDAIEDEHRLHGEMPWTRSVGSRYDHSYAAHDEGHQSAHQIEMARCFEALEGEDNSAGNSSARCPG